MKKTLLLFLFFICLNNVSAQEMSITPNPSIVEEAGLDLENGFVELYNDALMKNEGTQVTEYSWIKVVESAPAEWEFSVVDINMSHFPQIDTTPIPLTFAPSQEVPFRVSAIPNGVAGCGTVRMDFTLWNDTGNDEIIYSAYFEFKINNSGECLSSLEDTNLNKLILHPNPTTNSFKIDYLGNIPEVNKIAIFNLMGKQVKSFSSNMSEFNIEDLPAGLYSVGIINTQRGVLKTMRMTKITHN